MSRIRRYTYTIVIFGAASLLVILFSLLTGGDRIGYTLPDLALVDPNAVREIVIARAGGAVSLARTEHGWLVRPGGYPAHQPSADFLLDALVNLTIMDVVSTRDDLSRFDLDEEHRISVALIGTGEGGVQDVVLRAIEIGRLASTYGHTYVRIPGDNRILQAQGQLRTAFDRNVEILRDKSVFAFDPADVTEIVASAPFSEIKEVRVVRGDDGWQRASVAMLVPDNADRLDRNSVDGALSFFGSLPAYIFRYEGAPLTAPWLVVEFVADKRHVLSVYKLEGNLFPARTSNSEYDFKMAQFQVSFITELLGIELPLE